MHTVVHRCDPEQIKDLDLQAAADLIKAGEIVAFPTETVYGLGANALDASAVAKIFTAKGRPPDNPLIVHISQFSQLQDLVEEIPPHAEQLCKHFWPGPLTILFKRRPIILRIS